jgi:hypothetical protein
MYGYASSGRAMRVTVIKAYLILVAAMATLALALVVLLGKPAKPYDLLAWAVISTAVASIILIFPER